MRGSAVTKILKMVLKSVRLPVQSVHWNMWEMPASVEVSSLLCLAKVRDIQALKKYGNDKKHISQVRHDAQNPWCRDINITYHHTLSPHGSFKSHSETSSSKLKFRPIKVALKCFEIESIRVVWGLHRRNRSTDVANIIIIIIIIRLSGKSLLSWTSSGSHTSQCAWLTGRIRLSFKLAGGFGIPEK